jgi:hypothetical protein
MASANGPLIPVVELQPRQLPRRVRQSRGRPSEGRRRTTSDRTAAATRRAARRASSSVSYDTRSPLIPSIVTVQSSPRFTTWISPSATREDFPPTPDETLQPSRGARRHVLKVTQRGNAISTSGSRFRGTLVPVHLAELRPLAVLSTRCSVRSPSARCRDTAHHHRGTTSPECAEPPEAPHRGVLRHLLEQLQEDMF